MKLRDYQEASVEAIFKYFEDGGQGNPLVALPTGTGKSLVLAEFMRRAYQMYPGQRFISLVHVKELIAQDYAAMLRLWPQAPAGIYSAGLDRKEYQFPITFAGIASAFRNPQLFGKVDLVLVDEAHLVSPKDDTMYQKFIYGLREANPLIKIIGFTATHYRLGQGLLVEDDGLFTDICFNMTERESFNWLLAQGYISPLVPKKTNAALDVDRVRIQAGEYVLKDLQAAVDKQEVTYAALQETLRCAADRRHWLVFCSGVEHAVHVMEMLESLGVPTTCVHSKMPDDQRDRNIADFKAGKYVAMTNNNVLTTGFDYPDIDLIVMLRPTQSPGLWVQMLGRGTRPVFTPGYDLTTLDGRLASIQAGPKKNCLVLDFAGNTKRLGPINDPVIPKRKGEGGGGQAPVKLCEVCGTYNHASVRICAFCGAEFPRQHKLAAVAGTDALIANNLPQVETFRVDRVTYQEHRKSDRPPSLRVSYYCGLRRFEEWICLEHLGFAKKRAREWWRFQAQTEPPETTAEALMRAKELRCPTSIRVWVNKTYPEIMGHTYGSDQPDSPAAPAASA